MRRIYRFTKGVLYATGIGLCAYGSWFLVSWKVSYPQSPDFWFGLFPAYIGAMSILIAIAMKEDWFTDARKYW